MSRSVKRIKGMDHPPISEDFQMVEDLQPPLSYRDSVIRHEPIVISHDTLINLDLLEEESDTEDNGSIPTILISKEEKNHGLIPLLSRPLALSQLVTISFTPELKRNGNQGAEWIVLTWVMTSSSSDFKKGRTSCKSLMEVLGSSNLIT
ncbi:hypothetical protein SLA2020_331590 [Shorea laevis]